MSTLKGANSLWQTTYLVKLGQRIELQINIVIKIMNIFCNVTSVNHTTKAHKL